MDADRRIAVLENERGMTLVWVAIMLVAFCAFLGLAIDMSYMYVARGELQNAADAAALAGASRLVEGTLLQPDARTEAQSFARNNSKAAGKEVELASDGSNALHKDNDIVVGNWDVSRPVQTRFAPGVEPVNAVQVRARRTAAGDLGDESPGRRVDLFFARLIADKWAQMGVSASAIAARPPRAGFYIMLGRGTCGKTESFSVSLADKNMAWTSLLDPSSNAADIKESFVCPDNQLRDQEVCGTGVKVYTTNGVVGDIFKAVELDFYDPDYDRGNKTFSGGVVTSWTLIVPVSTIEDPSLQPSPQPVWGYAKIVISRACGSGSGYPCHGRETYTAPKDVCSGGENDIVISSISCVSCDEKDRLFGARPGLVQ